MSFLKSRLLIICAMLMTGTASSAPIYWTDWTGINLTPGQGFKGQGTITTPTSTVTVTYTNPQGIWGYQASGGTDYWQNGSYGSGGRNDAISPYTSSLVENAPTGADIILLEFAGHQTLLFSQEVANPVFAFVSLNGNGYSFLNQDFDILSIGGEEGNACGYWGCGGVTKNIIDLGNGNFEYQLNDDGNTINGTEPHGVIRFKGAFSALTWESQTGEAWNGFTVGVQGTAQEVFIPEPTTFSLLIWGILGFAAMGFRYSSRTLGRRLARFLS